MHLKALHQNILETENYITLSGYIQSVEQIHTALQSVIKVLHFLQVCQILHNDTMLHEAKVGNCVV